MEPVQIKLYGLFSRTRQRYLSQQLVSVVLALSLLLMWLCLPSIASHEEQPGPDGFTPGGLSAEAYMVYRVMSQLPWIVGVLLTAVAVETAIVLWLFARKEAAVRAAAPVAPVPEEAAAPVPTEAAAPASTEASAPPAS